MLAFYKGWGYWQYDLDHNPVKVKLDPMEVSTYFRLPEDNKNEVTILGKTTVNYLLRSSDTNEKAINKIQYELDNNEINHAHFILCQEWKYGSQLIEKFCLGLKKDIEDNDLGEVLPLFSSQNELEQANNSIAPIPEYLYLDPKHSMLSEELAIAIKAFKEVLENPDVKLKSSPKKKIEEWLEKNYPDSVLIKSALTKSAKERIATLVNPNKNGGAPPSI
jgi:hypothetical protein